MGKKPVSAAYVLGVGLTKFIKPRGKVDYTELGFEAGVKALLDAQINYDDVDQGVACYCYGDSTCGQRVFYQFGMTQIPIYNVNNNCSTGSTGLHMARNMVGHGMADCVMVVGFEKMFPGSLQSFYKDREDPCGTSGEMMRVTRGRTDAPGAAQMFGQHLATDRPDLFDRSAINLMGFGMTQHAARTALAEAEVDPKDVRVCELHDCFSANEMITLDALGLCDPGKAHEMVRAGDITYGGRSVVNPSGGLISKGHPLGATGIAQCAELVWQLRGWANNRLVEDTKVALQHNLGLGGAAVVTVYKRADGKTNEVVRDQEVKSKNWVGYNPAVEAKGFTKAQVDHVRSKKSRSEWALQDTEEKVEARF
ncbi:MAG: hypothetical protein ASARMPRED_005392 [Alectoria sarmentosa]|nr:MAG: hypothetical protein ASARMPRED_005392 [Alectoria sarmentosa]